MWEITKTYDSTKKIQNKKSWKIPTNHAVSYTSVVSQQQSQTLTTVSRHQLLSNVDNKHLWHNHSWHVVLNEGKLTHCFYLVTTVRTFGMQYVKIWCTRAFLPLPTNKNETGFYKYDYVHTFYMRLNNVTGILLDNTII